MLKWGECYLNKKYEAFDQIRTKRTLHCVFVLPSVTKVYEVYEDRSEASVQGSYCNIKNMKNIERNNHGCYSNG